MRPRFWIPLLAGLALALAPTPEPAPPDEDQNPRVRLRISGNMQGYLEPCGCASGQLGGFARRSFQNALNKRNIDLLIEGGQLIKGDTPLDEFKLMTILELLAQDGYHAVGIGKHDLVFQSELVGALFGLAPGLSADLRQKDGKPWTIDGQRVFAAYNEHKVGPLTVRLTGLTFDLPAPAKQAGLQLLDPDKAWAQAMQGAPEATLRVLIAHADKARLAKLELTPRPDLIVCVSDDYVEPRADAEDLGGVPLVHTGHKGRFVLDVHLARRAGKPVVLRHDVIKLAGSRTAPGAMESKTAKAVLNSHRQMVAEENLLEKMANQRDLPKGQGYIGSQACAVCHPNAAQACADDHHNKAWKTLQDAEKREKWPVTKYPECVSCHVVGYGDKGGFVTPKKTPKLLNVGCENCHGPGKLHQSNPVKHSMLGKEPGWQVRSCVQCHNAEHSPQFLYLPYWKKVQHGK